jgi:hypothetical protein
MRVEDYGPPLSLGTPDSPFVNYEASIEDQALLVKKRFICTFGPMLTNTVHASPRWR